ncbi:hypothetical protein ACQPZK_05260 [Micromonospora sp. CA-249363]|uniref:hypothetical protein n=1 Tax=Micromonospora sp. CA-249363 TaxID=3239963 RepID=UPI003D8A5973
MARWEAYDMWNEAIAEVFFCEELGGQPVYIDLDNDTVPLLSQKTGTPVDEVENALAAAVRQVLRLGAGRQGAFDEVFTNLKTWLGTWRRTVRTSRLDLSPPPVLAVLAVFSMAAERMGGDATMAPSNYFGRLAQVLAVPDGEQRERLAKDYRRHVEFFWHVLSLWLTGLDGMRGLPSAVALTHRYIGLSVSQALVREHDRQKLPRFFMAYGLMPGQEVSPREMEALLDEWLKKDPPPISRSLAKLWRRQPAARERIAAVVSLELQSWDGISAGDAQSSVPAIQPRGEVRLVAMTRSGPFGSSVEFNIVSRLPGVDRPQCMAVSSAVGDNKPLLDFIPGPGGWHRLHRPANLEKASVLDGILSLTSDTGSFTVQRRPRRVVPMRRDESLGLYLEVERLPLAEDGLVFTAEELADEVERALDKAARPGFRRVNGGQEGVPANWVLFSHVQLLALLANEHRSNKHQDLNVLLPTVASQLTLADGLKLPGQMRKYSSLSPPEIRSVAVTAEYLRLEVLRKHTDDLGLLDDPAGVTIDQAFCKAETNGSALVLPLATEELEDGDYEALLYIDDSKTPAQRLPFSLRSGSAVDLAMWSRSPRLVHDIGGRDGWAVISAEQLDAQDSTSLVDGASADGTEAEVAQVKAPSAPWWTGDRPSDYVGTTTTVLTTPDPTSCLVTGAHHWDLPLSSSITVHGTCRKCGLVKRFPNKAWAAEAKRRVQNTTAATHHVDVREIEPVRTGSITWDVAVDALMHAGGGPFSALERISLQVEGSSRFVDEFARTLEVLGHLQVKRDNYLLRPVEWEISPSTLAELTDGSFLLVGYWPAAMRDTLDNEAAALGGRVVAEASNAGPTRWVLQGLTATEVETVSALFDAVAVARDAARSILRVTPNLSAVETALPQVTMPGARRVQRFHVASASWFAQQHAESPGAYRLESFGVTDVIRRQVDIARGTARIGTVQLVKHLDALATGRPLIAYEAKQKCLQVPLGADLPGLYGRAAVLCSGRPPEKADRLLLYRNVPADFADTLAARLAS